MICFVTNGLEIVKFIIMYEKGFQFEKRKKNIYYLLAFFYYVIASGIMSLLPDNINPLGIYVAFVVGETVILYNEKIMSKIWISIWTMGAVGTTDGIVYIALKTVLNQQGKMNEEIIGNAASLITILFLLVLFQCFGTKGQYPLKNVKKRYFIYIFGVGIINEIVITLLLGFIDFSNYEWDVKKRVLMFSIFCVVGLFFQLAFILKLAENNQLLKEKEELIRKSLKMQEKNYKYLEKKEQETKKFRHDIRKHLYVMDELGREGEYKRQQEYLHSILGKVEINRKYITVHNGIVDAIINRYMEICKEENIFFQVNGKMPDVCVVEPYDLCTIFGNLLENAVEAAKVSEEKEILITIGYEDNTILIKEENSYVGKLEIEKGVIKTTKEKKSMHGYGLRNMEESILCYNSLGKYQIQSSQKRTVYPKDKLL